MFYTIVRFVLKGLFTVLFRMKFEGTENIPAEGGAVLASTHIHIMDPLSVAFGTKRHLRFMAKEELFRFKPFGALLRALGAFPVRRGHRDKSAVEKAAAVVEDKHLLLIFPEGTRSKTGKVGAYKSGAILIAHMADVPIIPIAILAKHRYMPFGGVTVRYGKPISVKDLGAQQYDSKILHQAAKVLHEKTVALLPEKSKA